MIYCVQSRPWVHYRIGDCVVTCNNIRGCVLDRVSDKNTRGLIWVFIEDADGIKHKVKEHYIRGVIK